MNTVKNLIEALELANTLGFGVEFESLELDTDLQEQYNLALEFIWDTMPQEDYGFIDASVEEQIKGNLSFDLPSGKRYEAFGEFGYDATKGKWTEVVQDIDGKMYNVEW